MQSDNLRKYIGYGAIAAVSTIASTYLIHNAYKNISSKTDEIEESKKKSTPEEKKTPINEPTSKDELAQKKDENIDLKKISKKQAKQIASQVRYQIIPFVNKSNHKIFVFAITGGPCAGKTTALSYLVEKFPSFKCYVVPEMATMTVQAGVSILPDRFTPESHAQFTKNIMKSQMDLENYFYSCALAEEKNVIIICDRGILDNFAYTTDQIKEKVLAETGWTMQNLGSKRYDAVFHLVTAADGAEEFYTLGNNDARSESLAVAKDLDKRTLNAYRCHENHHIIDNKNKGFDAKMHLLYTLICDVLNIPVSSNYCKKF